MGRVDWSLREQLLGCSHEQLAGALLRLAEQGADLKAQVLAALDDIGEMAALGELVADLVAVERPLNARETEEFATLARQVVPILRDLLVRTRPADVRGLAEFALSSLNQSASLLDDASGAVTELAREIAAAYLEALQMLAPLADDFGSAYVKMRIQDEYECLAQLPAILPLLSPAGVEALRVSINALWMGVPTLGPDAGFDIDMRPYAPLKMLKLELAQHEDDWRGEFEVAAKDLRYPGVFAHLALLCEENDDPAQAREWLERGVRAHPQAENLRLLLAELMLASGERERALQMVWQVFEAAPENRRAVRLLERCAGEEWSAWVPRVLELTQRVGRSVGEHQPRA